MLMTAVGWQVTVSSVQLKSWNDRVEEGSVLKDLRCRELDLGIHWGGRVIIGDLPLSRVSIVLRYC